jgi:predicted extracellular nuclease
MNRNNTDRTFPSAWVVAGGLFLAAASGAAAQEAKPAEAMGPAEKVSIMQIQGKEQFSSWAKKNVETTGVVTQLRDDGIGFWIQDPKGDGDRATSDGIWISYAGIAPNIDEPLVGDLVRVTGTVDEEQQTPNALPLTRLKSVTRLEVISHGNKLPDPVAITTLPKVELKDGITFWEPLEGMRVRVGKAMAVSGTEAWGEYSVVTAADAVPGSGYYPNHHILLRSLGPNKVDYNPEVIVLQSSSRRAPLVKPGDEFSEIVGGVDYTDGVYKIWPDKFSVQIHELPRPPLAVRSGKMGNLRVVGYNMSNLMDDIDTPGKLEEAYMPKTPAELDIRLEKMAQSIIVELQLPDIITGNEVESTAVLQAVGDRVNERTGARYRAASMETYDARGLEASFLYDENKVHLEDYYQIKGDDVVEAFSPSRPGFIPNRVPLVGVFRVSKSGPKLLVVANKFKTKRLEDPRLSVNMPSKRFTEVQRKLQAKALRRWVDETLAKDPNALILLTGDFGDFQFGEPEEGEDHPIGILEGLGNAVKLVDLVNLEDPSEAYDYIFQGNGMCVSHMLASPALMKMLVGTDILHINASYPDRLLDDKTTPIRASDRDPIEGRFDFPRDTP